MTSTETNPNEFADRERDFDILDPDYVTDPASAWRLLRARRTHPR